MQLVDLLTGRIEWLRIETPGEDAVEFRCRLPNGAQEAYQAKRGRAQTGHWTIAALTDVLLGFGDLLRSEPTPTCVFVSEHAAAELGELIDRARASVTLPEFRERFLAAKKVESSWQELRALWNVDEGTAWAWLRRIKVVTTSETFLIDTLDRTLGLTLDASGPTGRAILTQLAIESVHRELTAPEVIEYLRSHSIQVVSSTGDDTQTINAAPVASGIPRTEELKRIKHAINCGSSTVVIGGLSGMGKTTLAAQFAADWKGPVCWIDCDLLATELEVLGHIGEYFRSALNRPALSKALGNSRYGTPALAKVAGNEVAALRCLMVWDGLDGERASPLRNLVRLMSVANAEVTQIVTAQDQADLGRIPSATCIHVERLSPSDERELFLAAFPEARLPDLEKAASITDGYPYLIHLLCGAAQSLDFHSAIEHFAPDRVRVGELVDAFLKSLRDVQRRWLVQLSWLGVPFSAAHFEAMSGSVADLYELASRHFVLRYGINHYRVHSLLTGLIAKSIAPEEQNQLHEWSATLLKGLAQPTWMEMRALLVHATKASMVEVADETAHALLHRAVANGHWALAREAANAIVEHADGTLPGATFYAHFVLGKHARITGEGAKALQEYKAAEEQACNGESVDTSRYEQASVMVDLGRLDEAIGIYRELSQSARTEIRVGSLVALGMVLSRSGDTADAEEKIKTASVIANDAGLVREEADANHALGQILADRERYDDAIKHLRQAHSLRMSMKGGGAFDVYGWFHLMHRIAIVERHLGDPEKIASATRGMWGVACASGNITWEADSAFAMCDSSLDPLRPELDMALDRLMGASRDTARSPEDRIVALHGIVLCAWTLDRFAIAFEAILDGIALSKESALPSPTYAHCLRTGDGTPKVHSPEDDVFFLSLPPDMDQEVIVGLVSEIMNGRPELAQYAVMLVAQKPEHEEQKADDMGTSTPPFRVE